MDRPQGQALVVDGLVKTYPRSRSFGDVLRSPLRRGDRVRALDGVSFGVARNELLGLLGPNGAGKTTLLKILCGLILPDSGRCEVLNIPAGSAGISRVIGLVTGEERSFYWRLTARENLYFFARLHGLEARVRRRRVGELLERVELSAQADRRFGAFSSGMRQRLAIARALLADPPVLLMDEPTRSLDPVSAAHLRAWIVDELHQRDGKTILIATHNLHEAESLCGRVAVLDGGRLRAVMTPQALREHGASGRVYRFLVRGAPPSDSAVAQILERRRRQDGTTEIAVRIERDEAFEPWLAELHGSGSQILSCRMEQPELEEAFQRLVGPGAGGVGA